MKKVTDGPANDWCRSRPNLGGNDCFGVQCTSTGDDGEFHSL